MELGLSGKTAVVAGGSRGCGRGISEVLATEGAAVVFSGRNRDVVTITEKAIRADGGTAVGVVADMTTPDDRAQVWSGLPPAGWRSVVRRGPSEQTV